MVTGESQSTIWGRCVNRVQHFVVAACRARMDGSSHQRKAFERAATAVSIETMIPVNTAEPGAATSSRKFCHPEATAKAVSVIRARLQSALALLSQIFLSMRAPLCSIAERERDRPLGEALRSVHRAVPRSLAHEEEAAMGPIVLAGTAPTWGAKERRAHRLASSGRS